MIQLVARTTAKQTARATQAVRRNMDVALALAILTGMARGFHTSCLHGGAVVVDPYWAQYYLLNAQDGFHHRALVGTLLRTFAPHGISVLVIGAIALLALASLMVALWRVLRRALAEQPSACTLAAALVLSSSCMVSVFAEVLGDLLQVCFILVAAACVLCLQVRSRLVAAVVALAAAVVCMLLHEGSLLLLVPALLIAVASGRLRWPWIVCGFALLGALIAWNASQNNLHAHLTFTASTFPRHTLLGTSDEIYKGFHELRAEEYRIFFLTNRLRALWIVRLGGTFLPALAALVLLGWLLPPARHTRAVTLAVTLFLISLPLYMVAHDWPRFLALTLLLTLVLEDALWQRGLSLEWPFSRAFGRLAVRLRDWRSSVTVALAVVLLLELAEIGDFRMWGMPAGLLLALLPMLLGGWLLERIDPATADAHHEAYP